MSVQAGKFFDVKKTKDYFDGMNISMDEYIKKSEIANAEYLNFFSTDAFRGKTAKAVKMLVKNRAGQMLDDAVKAQNLVKDSQEFTLSTFAAEVDPAPNARIEYNTLRNIETDFKGFHNKFKSIALSVENIADRLNGEFGSYGYFGKPDSRPVLMEYESFCGGDADNTGYLSECIGKLVRFDGMVNSYITSKQIDIHSTTVSARAKSVGAALMTPVAKSPKMAKYEIKTISTEPVAKSGGKSVNDKYEALQRQFGFTDEEMEYLLENRPDLLSQLDGVRRFSSSDADKAYQVIRQELDRNFYNKEEYDVKIPETVVGTYSDGSTITLHPKSNWAMIGGGSYPSGVNKDSEGRYKVAVGPAVLNPDYPDNGKIWASDFNLPQKLDIYLKDKTTGEIKVVKCVATDVKAHSYSSCSELSFEGLSNGYVQTGIPYPNASGPHKFEKDHSDGSVVEFCGHAVDFETSNYELEGIKRVDE